MGQTPLKKQAIGMTNLPALVHLGISFWRWEADKHLLGPFIGSFRRVHSGIVSVISYSGAKLVYQSSNPPLPPLFTPDQTLESLTHLPTHSLPQPVHLLPLCPDTFIWPRPPSDPLSPRPRCQISRDFASFVQEYGLDPNRPSNVTQT